MTNALSSFTINMQKNKRIFIVLYKSIQFQFLFIDKIMYKFFRPFKTILTHMSGTHNKPQRTPPKVTWQHSWPSDQAQVALIESDFQALPTEVILHIFKFKIDTYKYELLLVSITKYIALNYRM